MVTNPSKIWRNNKFAQNWLNYKKKKDHWNLSSDYVEKPAMYGQMGNLSGKSILCLGCGSGEECNYLNEQGAKRVVGVDISPRLIAAARKNCHNCEFYVTDMQKLRFPDKSFDMVYSSLAMHFLRDWQKVLSKILKVLKPGGKFIFSVPHPIKWAAETERNEKAGKASFLLGYTNNKRSGEFRIYGDYLSARKVTDSFFDGKLTVSFYSRPISAIFRDIQKSGFKLLEFLEPTATIEVKKLNFVYWQIRKKIPLYIVIKLGKEL